MIAPRVGAGRSRAHPLYEWDRPTRTPHAKNSPERFMAMDVGRASIGPQCDYGVPMLSVNGDSLRKVAGETLT